MHCDWPPDSEAFGFGFPTPLSSVLRSSASCPCHRDCFGLSGNTVTLNLFELEQSFKILFLFMRVLMNEYHELIVLVLDLGQLLKELTFSLSMHFDKFSHLVLSIAPGNVPLVNGMSESVHLLTCTN